MRPAADGGTGDGAGRTLKDAATADPVPTGSVKGQPEEFERGPDGSLTRIEAPGGKRIGDCFRERDEARAEVSRLRAEVERLREALTAFMAYPVPGERSLAEVRRMGREALAGSPLVSGEPGQAKGSE